MKQRMIKLMACLLTAGILAAGQTVCMVSLADENIVIQENGAEQETEQQTETEAAKKKKKKKKKAQTETSATESETETESESVDLSMKGQMIFAQCEDHINIRKGPGVDSDVVGKIYNDCMATVLSRDGEWFEIQSGNAVGFVKVEYFATGEEAQAIAEAVGYNVATIYADELNIRALPDDDSEVIGVAYKEEELEAVEYKDDWIKVALGDDVYGYVNAYYAGYDTYYPEAETLEEEQARLDAEAAAEEEYAEEEYLPEETYTPSTQSTPASGGQSSWTPPQTQAPETQAPQTQAPETQAPETQAPETQAPETQAPETQAPENTDPDDEYVGEVNDDMYYDSSTGEYVKF